MLPKKGNKPSNPYPALAISQETLSRPQYRVRGHAEHSSLAELNRQEISSGNGSSWNLPGRESERKLHRKKAFRMLHRGPLGSVLIHSHTQRVTLCKAEQRVHER